MMEIQFQINREPHIPDTICLESFTPAFISGEP